MPIVDLPYSPRPRSFLIGTLVCGALALFMGHEALTNRQGLIIEGLFRLSPPGATIFYWAMLVLFAAVILFIVPMFLLSLKRGHRIVLTDASLSAPKFISSKAPTLIPLGDIEQLWIQSVHKQRLLNIRHRGGRLSIAMSFLPDEQAFNRLCGELERRVASLAAARRLGARSHKKPG